MGQTVGHFFTRAFAIHKALSSARRGFTARGGASAEKSIVKMEMRKQVVGRASTENLFDFCIIRCKHDRASTVVKLDRVSRYSVARAYSSQDEHLVAVHPEQTESRSMRTF